MAVSYKLGLHLQDDEYEEASKPRQRAGLRSITVDGPITTALIGGATGLAVAGVVTGGAALGAVAGAVAGAQTGSTVGKLLGASGILSSQVRTCAWFLGGMLAGVWPYSLSVSGVPCSLLSSLRLVCLCHNKQECNVRSQGPTYVPGDAPTLGELQGKGE
jgi:hypothetical protein